MKRGGEIYERAGEVVRLVRATVRKYYGWLDGVAKDDAVGEGVLWVMENAEKFDAGRGAFATFVCFQARAGISRFLKREIEYFKGKCSIDGLEEVLGVDEYDLYDGSKEDVANILSACNWKKGSKKVIIDKLAEGKSQTEIANETGMSKQYVSYTFKRFKEDCQAKFKYEEGILSEKER